MKQYLIVISYKSHDKKNTLAMQDTQNKMEEWVRNTLEIEDVKEIISQQFAIIATVKYEKDEETN